MNVFQKLRIVSIRNITSQLTNNFIKKHEIICSHRNVLKRNSGISSTVSSHQNFNAEPKSEDDDFISNEVLSKINQQIKEKSHDRLFAVIQLGERKFKITNEDIIALNCFFPPNIGEKICLEKVLLVGSTDFTLIGRPVLSTDLLRIDATIIEKTYIVPRPIYRHGYHYRRLHWFRTPYTLIRINNIEFKNSLDELPDTQGIQNRVIY
ncbi:hypothetical protein JTE90_020681 [Oedothorax gibbosus]|uniref:Large ribosomal subunit protein bL21m n=1 Tax=Oedothorax gibbosus TaxID=931172 RepID=A0AAV6V6E6_9ARAC|nr:hypothetical protein JTE90_020681 [Oedothorax gibbosus]